VRLLLIFLLGAALLIDHPSKSPAQNSDRHPRQVRLITLDPGHFHAALIQKRMYPDVANRVDVYAPLGFDLTEHLNRIARFNTRSDDPTSWQIEVHTGSDFFERLIKEHPGNTVVISGRNRGKIDRIKACVEAGLNVLADKPWIIDIESLSKLEQTLDIAARRKIIAYDIMTERYEIATILQRELVNDSALFGSMIEGTQQEPAVLLDGVHHLMKTVAGVPNLRPAWFFDVTQQGEGLADTGTHLVDLVHWILFPERPVDYRKDVNVLAAERWPTEIDKLQFRNVTGETGFPKFLSPGTKADKLDLYCNGSVSYTVRGIHVKMKVGWDYESPTGAGDTHYALFKGTKCRVEVRQGKEERYRTELYVVPIGSDTRDEVIQALQKHIDKLQSKYPGVSIETQEGRFRISIPDKYRVGHEEHFAQVTDRFLEYFKNPEAMPTWEKGNMLAKYYVTTKGVELSRTR
jgi:predicted dehydrogenase